MDRRIGAANGSEYIDGGPNVGKWYGFAPDIGATITELFINDVAVDVKADFNWDSAFNSEALRIVKIGDFISSITFSVLGAEMYKEDV